MRCCRGDTRHTVDLCDHVVPFGSVPGSIHVTFVDGQGVVTRVHRMEDDSAGIDASWFGHLNDPALLTDAEFFCEPGELDLPADLPPAARRAVAKARRDYLALVEQRVQHVRAEAPPFPRPEGAVRRLASEGDVLRLPAFQSDVDELSSRMAGDGMDEEVRVRTLFKGTDPGWRWAPFLDL